MAWIITDDKINTDPGEKTSIGEGSWPKAWSDPRAEILAREPVKFRMADDDGEVYFYGLMTRKQYINHPFGPLDDFGLPGYGCTEIQCRDKGHWETI